jgi:hypothetical protein
MKKRDSFGKKIGEKVCPVCKNKFDVGSRQPKRKYCSRICFNKTISSFQKNRIQGIGSRCGIIKIKCLTCGKEIEIYKNDLKEKNYCSTKCSANSQDRKESIRKIGLLNKGKKMTPEQYDSFMSTIRYGEDSPSWKSGVTYFKKHGNYPSIKYIKCPKKFLLMARKDGYIMEHRLIVAQCLNRLLKRSEVVHHINHTPNDNKINNLMLFKSNKDHKLYEGGNREVSPIWSGNEYKKIA